MALYGLHSSDPKLPEVKVVQGALLQKIKADSDIHVDLSSLSMSMVGILQAAPRIRHGFIDVLSQRKQTGRSAVTEARNPQTENDGEGGEGGRRVETVGQKLHKMSFYLMVIKYVVVDMHSCFCTMFCFECKNDED